MHECALGIHEIELVLNVAEGLGNGRRIGNLLIDGRLRLVAFGLGSGTFIAQESRPSILDTTKAEGHTALLIECDFILHSVELLGEGKKERSVGVIRSQLLSINSLYR